MMDIGRKETSGSLALTDRSPIGSTVEHEGNVWQVMALTVFREPRAKTRGVMATLVREEGDQRIMDWVDFSSASRKV